MAYWFGFAAVAGAFGGLVAFGIQHAHTAIANWRLLFIVEVCLSNGLSKLSFFLFYGYDITFLSLRALCLAFSIFRKNTIYAWKCHVIFSIDFTCSTLYVFILLLNISA